jgi:secreted PhoX family phosphatase
VPESLGVTPVTPADGGFASVDLTNDNVNGLLEFYRNKTIGDFYDSLGAALCDAYAAGNLVGGTPSARPEDCEVDPVTHDVYLSNTDGRPSGDGYPDSRIFVVGKYKAAADTAQQFGDLLKLTEDSPDGAGKTFTWSRLAQGGEVGTRADANGETQAGDGFGNADNLAFGLDQTLWVCIDQSTELHNGFRTGLVNPGGTLLETDVNHAAVGSSAAEGLIGVFGNNWLFYVPTKGPNTGTVVPFAIGPTRCEMTGPTFIGSNTLIVSIQHPGEDCSIRATAAEIQSRIVPLLDAEGSAVFTQQRTITKGSQWPSNVLGSPAADAVPIPAVVAIRRKDNEPLF